MCRTFGEEEFSWKDLRAALVEANTRKRHALENSIGGARKKKEKKNSPRYKRRGVQNHRAEVKKRTQHIEKDPADPGGSIELASKENREKETSKKKTMCGPSKE